MFLVKVSKPIAPGTLQLIANTIFMFMWSILSVYALDCATKGGCDQYAWFMVYLNAFVVVIYTILAIFMLGFKTIK